MTLHSPSAPPSSAAGAPALVILPPPPPAAEFPLLGVAVSARPFDETVRLLLDAPSRRERLRVHFAAIHTFVEAAKDPALRAVLAEAEIVCADGMPVVWLGRLKGRRVERVCGPDTMLAVLDRGRELGRRHFFYGGSPEILSDLVTSLCDRFPGLQVAGMYAPPFRPLDGAEVAEAARLIDEAAPDYVWVGLGSPKQDRWLAACRPLLRAPVLLAVGAAFDFHAGRVKRAPRWAQGWGLEWLFRLAAEPRRLAWRYVSGGLSFCRLVALDLFQRREVAR